MRSVTLFSMTPVGPIAPESLPPWPASIVILRPLSPVSAAMSASVSSVMAGVSPALLPVFLLESLPVSVAVPAASLAGPSISSVLEGLEGFVTGVVAGFVVCVLEVFEESDGFTAGFDSCVWLVAGVVGFVVLTELLPVVLGFCCTSGTAITAFELSLRLPKSSTTRPGTVPPFSGKIL